MDRADPLARGPARRFPIAVVCVLAAVACATPQTDALLSDRATGRPARIELVHVPHHPQQPHHCGPAALATVLNASGEPARPESLAAELISPRRRGTLALSIVAAARRHGRLAYPVRELDLLLAQLEAGHPVLVLQNLGLRWIPAWHYAVVIGYDLDAGTILLRSGDQARRSLALRTFERTWRRSDSWGVVVLRPGVLPGRAEPLPYLEAAAGLERAGRPEAAAHAYGAATRRWPEREAAWIGLGNASYAIGDFVAAETAFREALSIDPADADAYNNLAHVLAARGRREEALSAARQALRLGGARSDVYRSTLEAIAAEAR